jgi:RNA ligase
VTYYLLNYTWKTEHALASRKMNTKPILSYKFPVIHNLYQVREAIGDMRFFAVTNRGEHTFSAYKIVTTDAFPPLNSATNEKEFEIYSIRREIRGLAFDSETGELVSRCLHKFFNIGEKLETSIELVAERLAESKRKGETVHILDKLDGSMVTPIYCNNKTIVRYRTKMGYGNDTSDFVEKFVKTQTESNNGRNKYEDFCKKWMDLGYTPIFEFYSPESAIVLKYDHSFLTLIALRHVYEGKYLSYDEMVQAGKEFDIEAVKAMEFNVDEDANTIVRRIKAMTGLEGCVMRFQDGTMLKVKTKWYTDLHMCKHFLVYATNNTEKHVWELVLENKVDDTVAILNGEDEKKDLTDFNDQLLGAISDTADRLDKLTVQVMQEHGTGQAFATNIKGSNLSSMEKTIVFSLKSLREREGFDPRDILINRIGQQFLSRLPEVKEMLRIPNLNFHDMRKESLSKRPQEAEVFGDN